MHSWNAKRVNLGTTGNYTPKVFGIGLGRTGTTSLCKALSHLGYRSVHFPTPSLDGLMLIKQCDAAADTSVAVNFQELDQQFPNSKFIFTVRNRTDWIQSCERLESHLVKKFGNQLQTLFPWMKELRQKTYGQLFYAPEVWWEVYQNHQKRVLDYFKDRKQDLLIMQLCEGEGWQRLCHFLDKPIPEAQFPTYNQSTKGLQGGPYQVFFPVKRQNRIPFVRVEHHPTVSVILPTYNRLNLLDRALQSVAHQSFLDFEIIVVDDASTDGTAQWVEDTYPQVKLVKLLENSGSSAARNAGILEAKGKYIAFLDSDDEWLPEYLHHQIMAIYNNPAYVFCFSNYFSFLQGQDWAFPIAQMPAHKDLVLSMLFDCFIHTMSELIVPATTFKEIGLFKEDLAVCHDQEFYLRALSIGNPLNTKLLLVKKYWASDSLTVKNDCNEWLSYGLKLIDTFCEKPEGRKYSNHREDAVEYLKNKVENSRLYFRQLASLELPNEL
ncbi:MAG: glycosyltransferase [Bacteroidota bacterium]